MTIKKILQCSGALLVIASVALIASLIIVGRSNQTMQETRAQRDLSLQLATELRDSSRNLTATIREFAVTGNERAAAAYMDIAHIRAGEKKRPGDRAVAPGETVSLDALMKKAGFTEKEFALMREAGDLSNKLILLETEAMNAVRGVFPDSSGAYTVKGEPDKARAAALVYSDSYDGEVAKIMAPFSQFEKELDARLDAAAASAMEDYNRSMLLLRVTIGILIAMFVGFLVMVRCVIVRPVLFCRDFAEEVASGKLDTSLAYASGNEIGSLASSLRRMLDSLRERIGMAEEATAKAEQESARAAKAMEEAMQAKQEAESAKSLGMRQAGEQLLGIAKNAHAIAETLSTHVGRAEEGAVNQQARLGESAAAMEQLNRAILDVAQSTGSTTETADETRANAMEGARIVEETVHSISAVDAKAAALQQSMNHLAEQADGIGKVMAVISDIADQTNLLALNAAIEAARAGEAGRGFAVVADEVRKLAEKTMQATGEVGSAVKAIQEGTLENIRAMQDASESVKASTELAGQAGQALHQIVEIARGTAEQIHSVAAATEEQSATCEQLTATTESISNLAGETLNVMSNARMTVADLESAVQQLLSLTEELRSA